MAFVKRITNLFLRVSKASLNISNGASYQSFAYRIIRSYRTFHKKSGMYQWKVPVFGSLAAVATSLSEEKNEVTGKKKKTFEDQVVLLIKHGKLAEMRGDYDIAAKYYHRALGKLAWYEEYDKWEADKILDSRIYVYDCLANLSFKMGEFEDAENLYKETMRGLFQKRVASDENSVLEISMKLCSIYVSQGKFEEAEIGYKYVIDSQEKKLKNNPEMMEDSNSVALLGMCCDSYSRFLLMRGRLGEAREKIERAIELATKSLGENNIQLATLFNDAANVAARQGDYLYALEKLQHALVLSMDSDSDSVPAYYCNLGEVYLQMGNMVKAKQKCQRALVLSKRVGNTEAAKLARACLIDVKKKTFVPAPAKE